MRHVGCEEFDWRDLLAIYTESGTDSAVYRAKNPETWVWTHDNMLLAAAVDTLRVIAWQKTRDGRRGRNAPEPIPRPGVEPRKRQVKGVAVPMDQLHKRMNDLRARLTSSSGTEKVRKVQAKKKPVEE